MVVVMDVFMAVSVIVPAVVFGCVCYRLCRCVCRHRLCPSVYLSSVSSLNHYNTKLEHLFAFISDCR